MLAWSIQEFTFYQRACLSEADLCLRNHAFCNCGMQWLCTIVKTLKFRIGAAVSLIWLCPAANNRHQISFLSNNRPPPSQYMEFSFLSFPKTDFVCLYLKRLKWSAGKVSVLYSFEGCQLLSCLRLRLSWSVLFVDIVCVHTEVMISSKQSKCSRASDSNSLHRELQWLSNILVTNVLH